MNKANEIINDVARQFGISKRAMLGKTRPRRLTYPRAVVSYILHVRYGISSTAVARCLNRSHATVLYHCRMVDDWMKMPILNREVVDAVHAVERLHGLTN